MKANAVPLLAIFETKLQLEVPLFQRQYVWNRDEHWEPLWEDITRKFTDYIEGRRDSPVHFLGAMVLDQKQVPVTHVAKRQVIDGQQRLTTFQVFLSAFRDFSREQGCVAVADECTKYMVNSGMMANPETDQFKVWPTQLDRSQYKDVLTAGSREKLEERHPLQRKKYARKYEPRARMVEAYVYFHDQIAEFFLGTATEPPLGSETSVDLRLDESLQALKQALQVVAIDLEQGDDAQVIFETLNARGEPLLPADLLRNYIFLRAARQGESQEQLYERHWSRFDEEFWRVPIKHGRLLRPRSDLFLQHYLASRRTTDIPIKHLFVEYKHWIETVKPFNTVDEELGSLARQGKDFRRIVEPSKGDPLYGLAMFLEVFDVRTSYPLLLTMLDIGLGSRELAEVAEMLESYLVRRAVCGLPTQNSNRVFLSLTRNLRRDGVSASVLKQQLLALTGDSSEWPTDASFKERWRNGNAYGMLGSGKLGHILRRVSDTFIDSKMEDITIESALTIEHIMPQSWQERWLLPTGERGLVQEQLAMATDDDPLVNATLTRHAAVQTLGNLTIITQSLNSSNSNSGWTEKREELMLHAILPINRDIQRWSDWNETSIAERGDALFERALKIWPRD
jgi:hypothetical protein